MEIASPYGDAANEDRGGTDALPARIPPPMPPTPPKGTAPAPIPPKLPGVDPKPPTAPKAFEIPKLPVRPPAIVPIEEATDSDGNACEAPKAELVPSGFPKPPKPPPNMFDPSAPDAPPKGEAAPATLIPGKPEAAPKLVGAADCGRGAAPKAVVASVPAPPSAGGAVPNPPNPPAADTWFIAGNTDDGWEVPKAFEPVPKAVGAVDPRPAPPNMLPPKGPAAAEAGAPNGLAVLCAPKGVASGWVTEPPKSEGAEEPKAPVG